MVESMINVGQLARELASLLDPDALLDKSAAAAMLGVSTRTFDDKYSPAPGFPQAIRLRTTDSVSHPRWKKRDLTEWIDSHMRRSDGTLPGTSSRRKLVI